jgi:hypothetical protein
MLQELTLSRALGEVHTALFQFIARRGLACRSRLFDDRFEIHAVADDEATPGGVIHVRFERHNSATRVFIEADAQQACVDLAYALRLYLTSEEAYDALVPTACPRCHRVVSHARANYCGSCGLQLNETILEAPEVPER